MKRAVFFAFLLLFLTVPVHAYDSNIDFRCGNLFVEKGVHTFQVLKHCGDPIFKEIYGPVDCCDDVFIEKWVYGPKAGYYYILFFKVGVLTKLDAYRVTW